jgi:hypothetical protein
VGLNVEGKSHCKYGTEYRSIVAEVVILRTPLMKIRVLALALMALTLVAGSAQTQPEPSFHPKDGFVPNAETAVKIAEAVLIPVYGEKQILSERPFKAELHEEVWTVEGTLHCGEGKHCFGGTAVVKISKSTGQVLHMIHYK